MLVLARIELAMPAVVDRAVGTWCYLPLESSYESGPGPVASQRRWITSTTDDSVTFVPTPPNLSALPLSPSG